MATDAERIKTLETELAALKAKVNPRQITATPPDEGARTTFPLTYPIEMPTREQFERLFDVVAKAYPKMAPEFSGDYERKKYIEGCGLAFGRLTSLRRLSGLIKSTPLLGG